MAFLPTSLAQASVYSAQCQIQANDAYGQPANGIGVVLELQTPSTGAYEVIANGYTDGSGHATLSGSSSYYSYDIATCSTNSPANGYAAYGSEQYLSSAVDNAALSGALVVLPKPTYTLQLAGGGTADLYRSSGYDKPVVVAQPFNSAETVNGRFTANDLWSQYNGDPRVLSGGGMLARLYSHGYDVWLVRPALVGQDLNLQASDYAQAVQNASTYQSYNGQVTATGYSMGGLVVRIAMSKWSSYGWGSAPPVNLIATLDSPLRGALVSNDLQHAFWNTSGDNGGGQAHEHNMDSCSAQQMLENACHKTLGCPDCLECNDRGWYETFYGGNSFTYCSASQGSCDPGGAGLRTCSGVALLNQPNGGWPAGIRKIAASLGKFNEKTGVCYGDATGLDKTGTGTDGCPTVDSASFDTGTEWGYIDIRFSTDRVFYYQTLNSSSDSWRQHWIDELTPGSRQPGSVEDVAKSVWIFKIANGHQLLHMGTFLPLYSALDVDPASGAIPFDEYWTNTYSAFHDALTDHPGNWVNQKDGSSGSLPLVDWLIKNLDTAFGSTTSSCGEASCVPTQGMYVSHFSGPGCTGTESYYLPYDGYGYACRSWDGNGQCGTIHRTVTNYSARINGGPCQDLWPSGNTLTDFVTIYR
jgi:hypothetical protein